MAYIKAITFCKVGRNDGVICDKCGQYITNIWTVHYMDGVTLHYGADCFDNLWKESKLNAYGEKVMRKALKKIETITKELEEYKSGKKNADNDLGYQYCQHCDGGHYWKGKPYEEYRAWMINECFPRYFEDAQKEVDRFSKINFKR